MALQGPALPGYSFLIWKLASVRKGSSRQRGHPSFTWPSSLRFQVRDADFFGVLSFPDGRDEVNRESGWQGPEAAPCLTCLEPAAAQSPDPALRSLLVLTDKCPPAALMTKKSQHTALSPSAGPPVWCVGHWSLKLEISRGTQKPRARSYPLHHSVNIYRAPSLCFIFTSLDAGVPVQK